MEGLQRAASFIDSYGSFMLSTHESPDADGIGAEILLFKVLKALGKKARVVNSQSVPKSFSFLDPEGIVEPWDRSAHGAFAKESGMIILDTSDELNLGIIAEEALPVCRGAMLIDHHESSPHTDLAGYIDSNASSTAELVLGIAQFYDIPLDKRMATVAYAGILYDTGSFIYPKTTSKTFRSALALVEAGANPHEIYTSMFENAPLGALLLQKRVFATMELHGEGTVALQSMRAKDLEETGAAYEDSENLINIPLKCKDIEISILVKENEEGKVRCSLRSKGSVNVSTIAQAFGGGGHRTAAGFRSALPLDEVKGEVLKMAIGALG